MLFGLFFAILIASETLHIAGVAQEFTRKLVHAAAAVLIAFFPWMFQINQGIVIASVGFIVFALAESYGLLPSVTKTTRRTYGAMAFIVGVIGAALLVRESAWLPFQISVVILGLSDSVAALVGMSAQHRQSSADTNADIDTAKTWQGSLAFFAVTLLILLVAVSVWANPVDGVMVGAVLLFTTCLTMVEYASPYGLDNLFLPILGTLMLGVMF